jgi:uncharacterized protein (TIGR02611 family)
VTEPRRVAHGEPEAAPGEPEAGFEAGPEAARDAVADDWEWRRRIRSNAHTHRIYKWVVGIVGAIVTIGGLVLVPAPGPGWVIVFVGVAILASEFEWAQRLLNWGKARLRDWNDWLAPKPLWFKGLVGLVTLALVLLIFYGLFLLSGVPSLIPDVVEDRITQLPGL